MKTISLKLPDGLDQQLAVHARAQRTTKSELVRAALEAYLKKDGRPGSDSCLDLAGDLIGSIEGPSDLSVNPKHLKGFGR